ncbi:single-stranded DNA-binding protein [Phascolarctobacterium succinatutens]|jgi:single-strand DNA-binding protein|uniref:single-stranded DNA-binding protein n=1 Tax=Phascolarctobacterium succinatutens TaxID=626940 RepID=UPI00206448D5|nr:single-stranded DNA-binding protein [Phascolarctobacterium succinatutens]DAV58447.1 MAG TPA: Single strand binding protein [Caudoviricetes sp.]
MNNIVLLGRLTKDADIRSTQSGKVVASFTLAVDRPYTQNGKREVDFIACQIWGKSAEVLGKSVHRGQRILLEGRLQIRQYTDKNGNKRTAAEVVADRFEFIERKEQTESQGMENFGQQMPFDEEIPF